MFELLLFYIVLTSISFSLGFSIYWWYVDKIKSITSAVVLVLFYALSWKFGFKYTEKNVRVIITLLIWSCVLIYIGYKVRLLHNQKIPNNVMHRRRRR